MDLYILPKQDGENSRSYVYNTLKQNIMQLRLAPGEALSEIELGKALQVSRTPVREAFIQLSRENLIDIFPQKGSGVCRIDMSLVNEGAFMRRTLEVAIYQLAAKGLQPAVFPILRGIIARQEQVNTTSPDFAQQFLGFDNQFHHTIFGAVNKSNIWQSIVALNTHYDRLRYLELVAGQNIEKILQQHEQLVDAFQNRDVQSIEELVNAHQENVVRILPHLAGKYDGYFQNL